MVSDNKGERTAERMAYLYGTLLSMAEGGDHNARRKLREYAAVFHDVAECNGVLNIKGEHFECDLGAGHEGLPHSSRAAEAIWGTSDLGR